MTARKAIKTRHASSRTQSALLAQAFWRTGAVAQ